MSPSRVPGSSSSQDTLPPSSPPLVDDLIRMVRHVAKATHFNDVEAFSDLEIRQALSARKNSPGQTVQDMRRTFSALESLRRMEKTVDMDQVKNRLLSGQHFVRGRDKNGRPIMWARVVRAVRNMKKERFSEALIGFFFVQMWAMALRRPGSPNITVIFDDEGRDSLDFNTDMSRAWHDLASSLVALFNPIDTIYVCGRRHSVRMVLEAGLSLVGRRNWKVNYLRDRAKVFDIASDPNDVPDGFMPGRGTPFQPNKEVLGNFETLLSRNAFANTNCRDLCFPRVDQRPFAGSLKYSYELQSLQHTEAEESERKPWKGKMGSRSRPQSCLPTIEEQ